MRVLLPTAILACLRTEPMHGYAIAQVLGHRGFGIPKGGSLYPVLSRLERDGAVSTRWAEGAGGPGRKVYHLTAVGRTRLAEDLDSLDSLAAILRQDSPTATVSPPYDAAPSGPASEGEPS